MRFDGDDIDEVEPAPPPEYFYTGPRKDVVVLTADEAEDDLPAVCLCCGAPATVWKRQFFAVGEVGHHIGIGGIGGVIALIFILVDVVRVASGRPLCLCAPFCDRHQNHWLTRLWIILGGVAALVLVFIILIALIILTARTEGMFYHGLTLLLGVGGIIGVTIAWALLLRRTIHKVKISRDYIVLGGVHDRFIDALEEHRLQRERKPARRSAGNRTRRPAPAVADRDEKVRTDLGRPGSRKAQQRCKFVCDQLTKGRTPEAIKADLVRQGAEKGAAEEIVSTVLEEMSPMLRARYDLGRYLGPVVIGLALLAALAVSVAGLWVVGLILALGVSPTGIVWTVASYRKIALAQRLEMLRRGWPADGVPFALPAEAAPAGAGQLTAKPPVPARPAMPSSQGGPGRPLARAAIRGRETERILWLGALALAPFCLTVGLLICGGILSGIYAELVRSAENGEFVAVPGPNEDADPNAPDPNEGPPPAGWKALFRSDNPAVWNTDSPGKSFALPVRKAHSKVRYLRLKRMDTGDALIIPITHKQLARADRPAGDPGHWWNGTARNEWGARHLGIVQVPAAGKEQGGVIGLATDDRNLFSGSGFGWKTRVDDRQYYCWQGKEIPKTAFEIGVTVGPLSAEEKRSFTGPDPEEGPAPHGWTVLFRSDDPSVWNTFSPGDKFAVPVGRAHSKVRYLRLTRVDTGDTQIIPISREQLAREPKPPPEQGVGWNGTAREEYKGRHLGILHGPRSKWPNLPANGISVMNDGWDSFGGSGFGHGIGKDDTQRYCWQDKEIPKTVFEIAVTADALTEEEQRHRAR
jgi:hypothetical protein